MSGGEAVEAERVSGLRRALARLRQGTHAALLYDDVDELLQVALPFTDIGRERNEQCVYLSDPDTIGRMVQALEDQGYDVEQEGRRGRLILLPDREYLVDGRFDPEAMIGFLRQWVENATSLGFAGVRSMGDMVWQLGPEPDPHLLSVYEPMLEAAARELPYVGLCLYRRADHPPEQLERILGDHSAVAVGLEVVSSNPFHQPPQLLVGDEPTAATRMNWKTAALHRAAAVEREADEQLRATEADQQAAVDALRANERRLRAVTEHMPQLVWSAGPGGRMTWVSPQWSAYTGRPAEEALAFGWLEQVHPEDRDAVVAAWAQAASSGGLSVEHRLCRHEDGAYRWFQTRASFLDEPGGEGAWYGTSTDIHDLKRLQEQQRVLLAELQHRTRNLLAVVGSVAHQTLDGSADLAAFAVRFDERLAALSRVQGLLSRTDRDAVTMGELVRMELAALGAEAASQRSTVQGPDVALPEGAIQTLALALHELATNALKHGALATPAGRLDVRWRTTEEGPRRRLLLEWRESGVARRPKEEAPSRRGYGRDLIERALPYHLDAHTTFHLEADTLRCSIDMLLGAGTRGEGA